MRFLPLRQSLICLAMLLAAAGMQPVLADGLRCDGGLVRNGDRMFEVRQVCGKPDLVVVLHSAYVDYEGFIPYREEWQYNFGPRRLMRFLTFQDGRLSNVRTGPHGFRDSDLQGRCAPFELETGISQLELLARCGEPDIVEKRIALHAYRLGAYGPFYPAGIPLEDWIYDFGSTRFYRIVTVINGRVVEIANSGRRGG